MVGLYLRAQRHLIFEQELQLETFINQIALVVERHLTKPFSTDELLARLRVALRHAQPAPDLPIFSSGELQVDLTRRLVTVHGEAVKLTPTEYALLRLMI